MSIYTYNISQATSELTPPNKRKPNWLAFFGVGDWYLQYLHDIFFNTYADGGVDYPDWDVVSYNYLDRVKFVPGAGPYPGDNAVYEMINPLGLAPVLTYPPDDPINWIKITNNFLGVRERSKYKCNRVVFEYGLNRWFQSTFRQFTGWDGSGNPTPLSDIYITNAITDTKMFVFGIDEDESSNVTIADDDNEQNFIEFGDIVTNLYAFNINIPYAIWSALSPISADADSIVRAFADKYSLGGLNYNIVTY